jgi:hypothetical protein
LETKIGINLASPNNRISGGGGRGVAHRADIELLRSRLGGG